MIKMINTPFFATAGLLTRLKARYGGASDYAAAKILDVSRYAISKWRNGHNPISFDMAVKAADLLELPLDRVLLECQLERTDDPELRQAILDFILAHYGKGLFISGPECKDMLTVLKKAV